MKRLFTIVIISFSLAACGGGAKPGELCEYDNDCDYGATCVCGVCGPGDEQCGPGGDAECGSDWECIELSYDLGWWCQKPCQTDADCPGTLPCSLRNICFAAFEEECLSE